MKTLASGNEAIARGAWEGGALVATAYPGTPSTEILEELVKYPAVDTSWSPNEKVALEVGMGAAFAGARVLVTMKHVGVNVAADPLMTLSYTGVNGGLVLVTADDPGMHSSQNEQDDRYYARFAKIPMLEPSDSDEARRFTKLGFEISEQFDTPVLLRSTTRISHGKSIIELEDRVVPEREITFERNPQKFVMIPAYARKRHLVLEERYAKLKEYSENTDINRIEEGSDEIGIIAAGAAYYYAKEAVPDATFLKLGMPYPFPEKLARELASKVKKLVVIEELEPFLEEQLLSLGIAVDRKPTEYKLGEYDPDRVRQYLGIKVAESEEAENVPPRPPVMCPGCPHRPVFAMLKKQKMIVTGDIGCYTLGSLPPLQALDTCVCMGAGIGHAFGMSRVVSDEEKQKIVAVIGDSTFVHSGITSLIDVIYNKGCTTVFILDNRTTAMTGRQEHPGTGKTLKGEPTAELDFVKLCQAIGVEDISVVDPYDVPELEKTIKRAVATPKLSVVITNRSCVLIREDRPEPLRIDQELCKQCGICFKTGCPAIVDKDGTYVIDSQKCWACGLCEKLCPFGAVMEGEE